MLCVGVIKEGTHNTKCFYGKGIRMSNYLGIFLVVSAANHQLIGTSVSSIIKYTQHCFASTYKLLSVTQGKFRELNEWSYLLIVSCYPKLPSSRENGFGEKEKVRVTLRRFSFRRRSKSFHHLANNKKSLKITNLIDSNSDFEFFSDHYGLVIRIRPSLYLQQTFERWNILMINTYQSTISWIECTKMQIKIENVRTRRSTLVAYGVGHRANDFIEESQFYF